MNPQAMTGDRLHIAFFGRRNAGKSSLINAITAQKVAIVSDVPGTTTDPVYKSVELQPLGPVVLIDTAGIDDLADQLGSERTRRTVEVLRKTDLALLVVDAASATTRFEDDLLAEFARLHIPHIIILNKIDLPISQTNVQWLSEKTYVRTNAQSGEGVDALRERMLAIAPKEWEPPFLRDLFRPGDTVLLVAPIDLGAPTGRLIMPQIKALRDIIDGDGIAVLCKERELPTALRGLGQKPALVVTDSQVFPQVAADVPEDVLLTSFSILSARQKGDLPGLVAGVLAVRHLKPGDKVLIAESCSHHPLEDDIGRVKIPRWLNHYVGGGLHIDTAPGSCYPDTLEDYKLVVHCGGCTLNRREMLRRQQLPQDRGVPVTNYGVLIAFLKGVFPRALQPFGAIYAQCTEDGKRHDAVLRRRMAQVTDV